MRRGGRGCPRRGSHPDCRATGRRAPGRAGTALYIQEKVHPKVLIDSLKRYSKEEEDADETIDLFADFNGLPDGDARTEFYQHEANWSNRNDPRGLSPCHGGVRSLPGALETASGRAERAGSRPVMPPEGCAAA